MFAGHMLLLGLSLPTCYLFRSSIGSLFSGVSFILTIVLTAFELLIQALQAYIFTILTAQYIGGALEAGPRGGPPRDPPGAPGRRGPPPPPPTRRRAPPETKRNPAMLDAP